MSRRIDLLDDALLVRYGGLDAVLALIRAVRVRATARGRRILERGRERRVAEFVRLLSGKPAAELETLGAAADILEGLLAPARRPS